MHSKDCMPRTATAMDRNASVSLENDDEEKTCYHEGSKWSPNYSESSNILRIDGKAENVNNDTSVGFKIFVIACCMANLVIANGFAATFSVLYAELIRVFDEDRSLVVLI